MSTLALARPEPLALRRRARQAMQSLAYLLAELALGVLYLIALPTAFLGGATALRRLLELERTLANRLLAARIPAMRPVMPGEPIDRRNVAFLASRLPLCALAAALCAIPAALVVELLIHAVEGFVGTSSYLGGWCRSTVCGLECAAGPGRGRSGWPVRGDDGQGDAGRCVGRGTPCRVMTAVCCAEGV